MAQPAAPAVQWAQPTVRQPERAVLLAAARRRDGRLLVAGERGLILWSDDAGHSWRQAQTPTTVSLTALACQGEQRAWATGHGGTVLRSDEGGQRWQVRLNGVQAAALAAQEAQTQPDLRARAEQLVADGADKPLLAVSAEAGGPVIAAGAYGLLVASSDDGQRWQSWMGRLPNPDGLHLYAVVRRGAMVYLAGEQGAFWRSTDGGQRFERLPTPYRGTYFGLHVTEDGRLLLHGLRGHAFVSSDRGDTWRPVQTQVGASLVAALDGPQGQLWLASQAGHLLRSDDGGQRFHRLPVPAVGPVAGAVLIDPETLLLVGLRGVSRVRLQASSAPVAVQS
ncbi:WD40/YVTN/BNR-like repeat-containing protein [Ideonella livida]|uniref:Photosynthesis system II assembly factor Ycf48/Hcf136-like domain-containing protein n=1 Tax=Ideonella livida TaxID=2707176 RepID=A0A7C9TJ32_9BURK|nr:hypothetical protein [Ideonella livida]NDY91799.1 hypothetical protein [Ideonella livida]